MSLFNVYTGLLKVFPLPVMKKDDVNFLYDLEHPQYTVLKSRYPIVDVAGGGDDFSKAVNLLHWVSSNIYHVGNYAGSVHPNAINYLDYSFGKGEKLGINCVALSTILAECLLAVGIKARKVFIMPCSPYDGDNHVVAEVFIKDMGKWVMLDPTYNAWFKDENGNALGLLELRSLLADQSSVYFNSDAKYNDENWTEETSSMLIEYFAKNLFYFQLPEMSSHNEENIATSNNVLSNPDLRFISLCPDGFDPKTARVSNVMYRKKLYGEQPWMAEALKAEMDTKYVFCSADDFKK